MRYSLLLLLLSTTLVLLAVKYFVDPDARLTTNPLHDLGDMERRDPDLAQAIQAADDQGDVGPLTAWINRADMTTRERLGVDLLAALANPKHPNEADATLAWKERNRFRAFIGLSTNNEKLDTSIDNLLAYTLVTGPTAPNPQDLRLAQSLLPRLRRAAKESNDPNIQDTIGCVAFAAHDFVQAKEDFAQSLTYLTQAHETDAKTLALEKRRLEAARQNAELLASHAGEPAPAPALKPLPREEGEETTTP